MHSWMNDVDDSCLATVDGSRARGTSRTLCVNKNPVKRLSSPGVLRTQWLGHPGVTEVVGLIPT